MNSEVHSSTGVAPNDLVFGGKLDLQGGFLFKPIVTSEDINISQWSTEMLLTQEKLVGLAQLRQRSKDER